MGTYGKLTSDRNTFTASQLNTTYDIFILSLVNLLPPDYKIIDGVSVYSQIDLEEEDPIAVQVETNNDAREAAKAMIRRWLRRNGYLACYEIVEPVDAEATDYLGTIEIVDKSDLVSWNINDMLAPKYADDPKVLGDVYQQGGYNFGRYGQDQIDAMVDQGRAWIETGTYYPFPIDRVQNIYENFYTKFDREYNTIEVQSVLPSSIMGWDQSNSLKANEISIGLEIKTDRSSMINMGSSFFRSPSILEAKATFGSSNILFGNNGSNYQQMSGTGQEFEMPLPGSGDNALVVSQVGNRLLKGLESPTEISVKQFTSGGKFKKTSAIINKVLPVSLTNQALTNTTSAQSSTNSSVLALLGNSQTSQQQQQAQQVVANRLSGMAINSASASINNRIAIGRLQVGNRINASGSLQGVVSQRVTSGGAVFENKVGSDALETVYNGVVKLRYTPRSSNSKSLLISKLSYTSSTATATTMSSELVTDSNTGTGFMRPGSLGTETFEDLGYNGWCVGAGISLFTMNIDDDVGFNGFAGGTIYDYGSVEEFDDGWTEGASPFARKDDSRDYSEDLSSYVDSITKTFPTTYNFTRGSLQVFWNGQTQVEGNTFSVSDDLKRFTTTFTPNSGDSLAVKYVRFYSTPDKEFDYSKNVGNKNNCPC